MIWQIGTLAFVALIVGTFGTWLADRDPPTTTIAVKVDDATVRPGGILRVQYSVVRRRSCAVLVERILYDSQRVRYPLEDVSFMAAPGPMGPDEYKSAIPIPRSFSLGEGRYRAITTYRCNPLHAMWPIITTPADVSFDVLGGTPLAPPAP